jgi:hypothetical protein
MPLLNDRAGTRACRSRRFLRSSEALVMSTGFQDRQLPARDAFAQLAMDRLDLLEQAFLALELARRIASSPCDVRIG